MPFQGQEYLINSTTAGDQSHPTQTVLGNGDILVTWESQENTNGVSPIEIRAEILNPDGNVSSPDFVVNAGGLINIAQEVDGYDASVARRRVKGISDTLAQILKTKIDSMAQEKEVLLRVARAWMRVGRPDDVGVR